MSGNKLSADETIADRILAGEAVHDIRLLCKRPDKSIYVSLSGSPIYDELGKVSAAVVCSRDITEQVSYDEMLLTQQKMLLALEQKENESLQNAMESKDQFLSLITHELKTPLAVINLAIQALEMTCDDSITPRLKGYISIIRQNNFRQLRLVNNLLDITRIGSGHIKMDVMEWEIVALTKSITESVQLFAQQKGIRLTFLSRFSYKTISVDAEKYERILLNLLSNAIKFTPREKTVTVKLSMVKGFLCLQVQDEGIGIPQDKLGLIFERFGQVDSSLSRQAEGTGIGLTLVKQFVETLNGSIAVKSKPGKGSMFTVLLPSARALEYSEKPANDLLAAEDWLNHAASIEFSDIYQ